MRKPREFWLSLDHDHIHYGNVPNTTHVVVAPAYQEAVRALKAIKEHQSRAMSGRINLSTTATIAHNALVKLGELE